jgi:hypothetical protein
LSFLLITLTKGKIMDTAQAFLADIQKSITNATKVANSIPRKGMNVYLDKSTMVMQTFNDPSAFAHAKKVTARAGQSSCLRNVLDAGGRLQ